MTSDVPELDVSRETKDRLVTYVELLRKWNSRINLVSKPTLTDVWTRHVADSVQLVRLVTVEDQIWLDLGTGGGLPGLVIAIILHEEAPRARVVMIESDARKCAFLRTVVRETGVSADVINARIEQVAPISADIITARALADLTTLCSFVNRHGKPQVKALLPKGRSWRDELTQAKANWHFKHKAHPSNTDQQAVILEIEEIEHV